ncbi:MAG: response regulator [Desulfobulbaceae bacterium]|nr:response regulator [Desulfobulbaceae bacterium]
MQPRVLLVNQDLLFLETLSRKLQQHRLSVKTASSDEDIFIRLNDGEVDVVLLDVRFNGEKAVQTMVHAKNEHPEIEVILLSNAESIGWAMAGMREGAFDDIAEPFDVEKLVGRIGAALKVKRKREGRFSFSKFFEKNMMAATFAQAGEFDAAKSLMDSGKKSKKASKKKNSSD